MGKETVRFRFSESKATEAAALVLKEHGGEISRLLLLKVLYRAERESLRQHGRPIVGGRYVSMDKGPLLSEVYDLIKHELGPIWKAHIETDDRDLRLTADVPPTRLSQAERDLVLESYKKLSRMGTTALIQFGHREWPEWCDPGGSSREITYEDILKNVGKSDEEIARIRREVEAENSFDRIFGT